MVVEELAAVSSSDGLRLVVPRTGSDPVFRRSKLRVLDR